MMRFWEEFKLSRRAHGVKNDLRIAFAAAGYSHVAIHALSLPMGRELMVDLDNYEMRDSVRLDLIEQIATPLEQPGIGISLWAGGLCSAELGAS